MMSKHDIESKLKIIKPELTEKFHVRSIGFFGSYANNSQRVGSDLDLIVEFSQPIGWKFFTLEKFLEQYFGVPIDLVTKDALKERIKKPILNQVNYV